MNATAAAYELEHGRCAGSEPGAWQFRVFYLKVNGQCSVVPDWRLRDTLQHLKLLNLYARIERLDDGASAEFKETLYSRPVTVVVTAGTWGLFQGPDSRLNASP